MNYRALKSAPSPGASTRLIDIYAMPYALAAVANIHYSYELEENPPSTVFGRPEKAMGDTSTSTAMVIDKNGKLYRSYNGESEIKITFLEIMVDLVADQPYGSP